MPAWSISEDPVQALAQPVLVRELALDLLGMTPDGLQQADAPVVEQRRDLVQAHAQTPQREDPVQALHVARVVHAVAADVRCDGTSSPTSS